MPAALVNDLNRLPGDLSEGRTQYLVPVDQRRNAISKSLLVERPVDPHEALRHEPGVAPGAPQRVTARLLMRKVKPLVHDLDLTCHASS